jgi:shikimate dehydrogenase
VTKVWPWREAPEADFAVIGDPVAHSRSPQMHQAAYDELNLPYRYVALHVPPGEVASALSFLRETGYQGVNVTVPHKEEVMAWCEDVEPLAARVRAVNTVRLRDKVGLNTDAPGFLETLADRGILPGVTLMLGAGGSARALAYALERDGWTLRIHNRTRERAEALVAEMSLSATVMEEPDPTDCHLILNTTSASLSGTAVALDWERVPPGATAYDLAYAEGLTPFLAEAAAHDLRVVDGRPLLVAQGALSFQWWLGVPPSRVAMAEAIR